MQEAQLKTTLLFRIDASEKRSDITIDFQVYPGLYDHITIVHHARGRKILYYLLDRYVTPDLSIDAKDFDGMTISVWKNGFLYAGGIWQIRWSHESKRHVLACICASGLELIEASTLLSNEEFNLVEQAIRVAYDYWEKRISRCYLYLYRM